MAMKASVVFEKPDPRYLAGELLRGSVSIQNPDPIQLRCEFLYIINSQKVIQCTDLNPLQTFTFSSRALPVWNGPRRATTDAGGADTE